MTDGERIERNKAIYADRQAGATYKELAKRYGIGAERARQIYLRQERLLEWQEQKKLYNTRLHIYSLETAKQKIVSYRKFYGEPLTESDKILLQKLESLIDVYSET